MVSTLNDVGALFTLYQASALQLLSKTSMGAKEEQKVRPRVQSQPPLRRCAYVSRRTNVLLGSERWVLQVEA